MANMKMNDVIKATNGFARAGEKLAEVLKAADSEAIQYAGLYFYTGGTGNIEKDGDSQRPDYRAFRERIRYYTDQTITFNKKEGVFEVTPKRKRNDKTKAPAKGKKGKPAIDLSKEQEKVATATKDLTEQQKAQVIVQQMERLGVSFEALSQAYSEYQMDQSEAA